MYQVKRKSEYLSLYFFLHSYIIYYYHIIVIICYIIIYQYYRYLYNCTYCNFELFYLYINLLNS